jgi:hypothetical protein
MAQHSELSKIVIGRVPGAGHDRELAPSIVLRARSVVLAQARLSSSKKTSLSESARYAWRCPR